MAEKVAKIKDFRLPEERQGFLARFTWVDTVFFLLVGTVFVWSLTTGIVGGTELVFEPFDAFFRAAFVTVMVRVVFLNKFTLFFAGTVLGFALIFMAFGALTYVFGTPAAEGEMARGVPLLFRLVDFLTGVARYITGFEIYQLAYDNFIQWSLTSILVVFVFVFGFLWFNFFALLAVSMVIFGLVLNTGFFFYNPAFYVFAFCTVAYLIRYLNQRSMMQGKANSPFMLYSLPITALCLALAFVLPTPQAGTARQLTDNFITRPFTVLNRTIQDFLHPRYFSLAQTGFGMTGDRRLGGNVVANYDAALRINHPGPVYLTGNIFDSYTGFSWVNTFMDYDYIMDFSLAEQNAELFELATTPVAVDIEYFLLFAAQAMDRQTGINDGIQHSFDMAASIWLDIPVVENTLVVEHVHRGFTVFTTGIVSGFIPPDGMRFVRGQNGGVLAEGLMGRNARYTIFYADLDLEAFGVTRSELLEYSATRPGMLSDIYERLRWFEGEGFSLDALVLEWGGERIYYTDLLAQHLIPRAQRLNEVYTALPEHLPDRIFELSQMVAEGAGAATPFEKARALDEFLRSNRNFGYTLIPGATPVDRDFVDHFLFDLQMGYCTHFASAFVVMARTLGLPTRYVEGFIVSGHPDVYGYLEVINRQGHAWAEVYFEGFGWHRFDPTPPEAIWTWGWVDAFVPTVLPYAWDEIDEMFAIQRAAGQYLQYWELYEGFYGPYGLEPGGAGTANLGANVVEIILTSVVAALLLAAGLLTFRIVSIGAKNMRIERKNNNEAAVQYFHRVLKYMRLFRYQIEDHETALEFAGRVGKHINFGDDKTFMIDLARIFSRACYSRDSVSEADRQLMERAVQTLDKRLWGYMGPRKYFMYKYVMAVV